MSLLDRFIPIRVWIVSFDGVHLCLTSKDEVEETIHYFLAEGESSFTIEKRIISLARYNAMKEFEGW